MKEPKYSTATILRYRELMGEKYFDRKVAASMPTDLMHDVLTLECGHTQQAFAKYKGREEGECVNDWDEILDQMLSEMWSIEGRVMAWPAADTEPERLLREDLAKAITEVRRIMGALATLHAVPE